METALAPDQRITQFLAPFAASAPTGYADLRAAARETLHRLPIPGTKTEAWRYTRVGKIVNRAWTIQPVGLTQKNEPLLKGSIHIDVLDGQPQWPTHNETGLSIRSVVEENALCGTLSNHATDWFEALNAAYFTSGVVLHATGAVATPVCISLRNSADQSASVMRNVIHVSDHSQLNILMHLTGSADHFQSVVTEIFVGRNATCHLDVIQEPGATLTHHVVWVNQEEKSEFTTTHLSLDGLWIRNDLNIRISGEHCLTNLNGAYLPKGDELVDNHTMVDHKVPDCVSNELYKGLVRDRSTGVFNGKVFVRPDAQRTNAFQQNANIVLHETAAMYSKPELEIYADDVKCSHGSTTGQFDEEAVFYLRARGIGEEKARKLLVEAFLADVVNGLFDESVRTYCTERIQDLM